jgi:hypothetical protein
MEDTKLLCQLDWRRGYTPRCIVVNQLVITGNWEILSQRMAPETVVSYNTAKILVAWKVNSKHISNLALMSACRWKKGNLPLKGGKGNTRNVLRLGDSELNYYPLIQHP